MLTANLSSLEFVLQSVEIRDGDLIRFLAREKFFKLLLDPLLILERSSRMPSIQTIELMKAG